MNIDAKSLIKTTVFSYSNIYVAIAEKLYLDKNLEFIYNLILSSSISEFKLKLDISAILLQRVDFLALIIGFQCTAKDNYDVLLLLIDNTTIFDSVLKLPKFIKMLLLLLDYVDFSFSKLLTTQVAYRITLAHIFKKFPALLKLNKLMYKDRYTKKLKTYFSEQDVEKYYKIII